MFRRLESGLPKDPVFPADLKGLGYFVNENDEIRNIQAPKEYFKFFLTKNERYNAVQREAMNESIRQIIYERLEQLGLEKIRLPLGTTANEPHVPIYISSDLKTKKRVVILFYEHTQDLGVFAHRIIGGKGGINQGTVVDFVKYIQSMSTSPSNKDAPGIILANMGQLIWWRRGKKAITQTSWYSLPQKSAVDAQYRFDEKKNTIPGNRTTYEHVQYVFNHVVEEMVAPDAELNVIGVSDGAFQVTTFLDNEENFKKWSRRINAFAAVATYYHAIDMKNEKLLGWFKDHARAYLTSGEPAGTFFAGPEGRKRVPAHGCPIFSLGEPYYSECMMPKGYKHIVDWLQETSGVNNYKNPTFVRYDNDDEDEEEDVGWQGPGGVDLLEQERNRSDGVKLEELKDDEAAVETEADE